MAKSKKRTRKWTIYYTNIAEAINANVSTVKRDAVNNFFDPSDLLSISQYIVAKNFLQEKRQEVKQKRNI